MKLIHLTIFLSLVGNSWEALDKDMRATQKILAKELDLELQTSDKVRTQKDESVRLEMTFTKEEMELLERAKELLSHVDPNLSWKELVVTLAERLVK